MIGRTASDAVVALERVVAVDREPPRRMHDVVVASLDDRRRARFAVACVEIKFRAPHAVAAMLSP